jgi:hypothetical protein
MHTHQQFGPYIYSAVHADSQNDVLFKNYMYIYIYIHIYIHTHMHTHQQFGPYIYSAIQADSQNDLTNSVAAGEAQAERYRQEMIQEETQKGIHYITYVHT